MEDGIERRALLLHLGQVLESMSCVAKCATRFNTLGEAVNQEDSLADFWFLGVLDARYTTQEFCMKTADAFFLWPKLLLDEELNRSIIANVVQTGLFSGNQTGWDAYTSELQKQVPWFGDGAGPVAVSDSNTVPWPPVDS